MIQFPAQDGTLVVAMIERVSVADAEELLARCHPEGRAALLQALHELMDYERALVQRATRAQWAITWGDFYTCQWAGSVVLPTPTRAWGRVLTPAEYAAAERAAGASPGQVRQALDRLVEAYAVGWRPVRAHSRVEPGGEGGLEHVANMRRIGRWTYALARAAGWPEHW